MLNSLEPIERYIIGGYIKRGDNTVLDIAVEAIDTPESIRRAMSTVRRTMTRYTPKVTPITIAAEKAEPAHSAVSEEKQASVIQESTTATSALDQEPDPQPTPAQPTKLEKPPEGVRGLVHLRCIGCGGQITAFLRMKQREFICRCGHSIDLTKPLANFKYTCPYCEAERWGLTNLEDPTISVKCKCGGTVDMQWVPKAKEYQN